MFGKRGGAQGASSGDFNAPPTAPALEKADAIGKPPAPPSPQAAVSAAAIQRVEKAVAKPPAPPKPVMKEKSEEYYDTKSSVFTALIDTIDLGQLSRM